MPTIRATAAEIAEWERKGLIPPAALTPAAIEASPSKYGNRRTEIDGLTFASKREARRYLDFREQQRAGLIRDLQTQTEIPIVVNGVTVTRYIADFTYTRDGARVVEDAKGAKTDVYRLKKKLLAALGVEVVEV
jgi:hypothetical protein